MLNKIMALFLLDVADDLSNDLLITVTNRRVRQLSRAVLRG